MTTNSLQRLCLMVFAGLSVSVAGGGVGRAVEPPADTGPSAVVATVGSVPILRAELDAVLQRVGSVGPDASAVNRPVQVQAAAIEQLIDQRLLRAEIDREGIVVGAAEIDAALGRLRAQMTARGVEWMAFLAKTGRDEEFLREQIALELGLDKLIKPLLRADAVEAAFAKHRREVDGTRLRVSHVVLRPDVGRGDEAVQDCLRQAEQIRGSIVRGEVSFAAAARRHSVGPSRLQAGDLGWITRRAPCIEEFNRAAFALAKGDISQPFTTPYGVHLVTVTDAEPGRLGLDAVRPQIESMLAADILRERIARARSATTIEYAPGVPHFDPAAPAGPGQPRRVVVEPAG
ncbi:MAG: peptidylprolyl isomerase [Pirellulales bacterium]